MSSPRFASYMLRTIDVPAAITFYDAVLGHHGDAVYPLHEQARARGARPHWLGCVHTDTPESLAEALLADGGDRLGPRPGGGLVVRDAGGAILALGPVATASTAGVTWHVLRTRELAAAAARYTRVFGWSIDAPLGAGPGRGFRAFAWAAGEPEAGVMGGVEQDPGVHPHWLHVFGVADLDAAVAAATERGATMLPTMTLPDGRRLAVGDDPQGAAFGMISD